MQRVMGTLRLMLTIKNNTYLTEIFNNCYTPEELEEEISKTPCIRATCLVDIDWNEVYETLKED